MNAQSEAHLSILLSQAIELLDSKYRRGNAEHNEILAEKPALELIDEALGENADQYFYISSARQQVIAMQAEIEDLSRTIAQKDRQIEALEAENIALLEQKVGDA